MAPSADKKRSPAMPAPPKIAKLVHYPVKGLRGLAKSQAVLTKREGMPLDRVYAIENGSHRFTDIAEKALHLVNLETVRDVSRIIGDDLDPLRFRANVYFDGVPAWQERNWLGKTIVCGDAHLKVFAETGRCEATSVDSQMARRGPSVPSALLRTWGHDKLGLYAKVVRSGVI